MKLFNIFIYFSNTEPGAVRMMDKKEATSFLKMNRRIRRSKDDKDTRSGEAPVQNPYDECCVKGCTLKEVAGYPC